MKAKEQLPVTGLLPLGSIHLQALSCCITGHATCSSNPALIHNLPFALDALTKKLQTKGYIVLETAGQSLQKESNFLK